MRSLSIQLALAAALAALAVADAGAQPVSDDAAVPDEAAADDDEPPLPAGLDDDDDEPALPDGLGDDEPALPAGLDDGDGDGGSSVSASAAAPAAFPLEWRASIDSRVGSRVVSDPHERTLSLAELRAQIDLTKSWRLWSTTARLVVDAVGDPLSDQQSPQLETGEGAVDLRTASIAFTPSERVDLRIGRQILTWGTGDLLFINDLFPKDWTAFLIGRDVDYLKAPSDAARIAVFSEVVALDLVLTPRFDADRLPLRDRVSTFDPALGRVAGDDAPLVLDQPDDWGSDGEAAVRLHRTVESWELAAYGYYGFWKSPAGFDAMTGAATFPALSVYGASIRGPVGRGIVSAEVGYYDSRDDRAGDDPFVRNSEARGLVGYERQLGRHLTAGAQYYVEAMRHHARYEQGLPAGAPASDRFRHVVTTRLRWSALRERVTVSLFAFASPSDRDGYVRASATYVVDDRWSVVAGGNAFAGTDDHTFFGQLENNSNAYVGVRYAR